MRIFIIILILIFALIIGAVWYFTSNADRFVELAIEGVGTEATQSEVLVESVELSLAEASAAINGLTIANPDGFEQPLALSLGRISVTLNRDETAQDLIVIDAIAIDDPQIEYEIAAGGGSNLDRLQENVEAYASSGASGSGNGGGQSGGAGTGGAGDMRFIVDLVEIRGGSVRVHAPGGEAASTDLPPITLRSIGRDSGGVTSSELGAEILDALTEAALEAAARARLMDSLGLDGEGNVIDGIRDLFRR